MILETIRKTVASHKLINDGDSIVIGLSGGADSICLTHALWTLKEEIGISTIYTAHLNHGIRDEEACDDEEFAKNFSASLGIKCFSLKLDIPSEAKKRGISEETAGRQARYEFFTDLCKKNRIDKIATAHNKNDNAETLLMNFMRGSAIKGLCGIPYRRGDIIRPILDISRAEVEEYCQKNNLEFVTDSTNIKPIYTRNKIRGELIPLIQSEFNPNFINTVSANARLFNEDSAYIEYAASEAYKSCVKDGRVEIETISKLAPAICRRVIFRMISEAVGSYCDLRLGYVDSVTELLKNSSGASVDLPRGVTARVEYGALVIEQKREASKHYEYALKKGVTVIPEISRQVSVSGCNSRKKDGAVYLSASPDDKIVIRSRNEGDVFYPCGMNGSKKVKQYFIDKKIPRDRRNAVPIIEINGEIAAVGDRVDRRFLFEERGIRIEIYPLEEVAG